MSKPDERMFRGPKRSVNMGDPDAVEAQLIELGHEQYMDSNNPECQRFSGLAIKLMAPALAALMRDERIDEQHTVHAICSAAALFASMIIGSAVQEQYQDACVNDTIGYFAEPLRSMVKAGRRLNPNYGENKGANPLFSDDAPESKDAQSLIDDIFGVARRDKRKDLN